MKMSRLARSVSPYTAGEQPQSGQYVKLNTNENPFPPSPGVGKALGNYDAGKLRLYPDPDSTALRRKIAERFGVSAENVFVGNGSDEVLALAFPALFDAGEKIVFPDVTYSFYPVYCGLYGISYGEIPLKEDFSIDVNDYVNSPFGIVIANPNAPTGTLLSLSDIERIVSSTEENVIIDEAYGDFAGFSAAELIKKYDNLLVVRTFSKSYCMAGIRAGFALGSAKIIDAVSRIKNCFNSYPVDRICETVAVAALDEQDYYDWVNAEIVRVRESSKKTLRELGFEVADSFANFLFVGDGDGRKIYEYLKAKSILVRFFDKPRTRGFVRITVGTEEQMNVLIDALREYKLAD
ncbi:MAG: histidinol-phosphate transaminase [Christensenellales bacterium]